MTPSTKCFDYICDILEYFGEGEDGNYMFTSIGQIFNGPSTDEVIKILFDGLDDTNGTMLGTVKFYSNFAPRLYTIRDWDRREDELHFSDCKEVFEITKKIRDTLLKIELERLMYPLPDINK